MSKVISNIIIFGTGAAIGSVVTWKLLDTKYKRIADEEIQSVKDRFSKKLEKLREEEPVEEQEETEEEKQSQLNEYFSRLTELNYNNAFEKGEPVTMRKPYVIPPEEFGENDYETVSFTYYADGVLTDEADEIVNDVEETVGADSLTHFGEYEEDSVFVRNDEQKIDYEILLDPKCYSDVKKVPPRPVE